MQESRISKIYSERITKRVIILILMMLFILPVFEHNTYFQVDTELEFSISALSNVY